MKVLVTGGSGFIGSHLVEELLNEGHEVRVAGSSAVPENLAHVLDRIEYIKGNIFTSVKLDELVAGIDVVYHLLWTSLPRHTFNFLLNDLHFNISFGISFLQACTDSGVKKVVFASSGGTVYGITGAGRISESHPLVPVTSYGVTKSAFERYLQLFEREYGLQYTIFRISNAYGERQDPERKQGVITTWLNNVLQGQAIEIWGAGDTVRDYVYVKDIVRAMAKALTISGSDVFNLSSGQGYSLNEILAEMEAFFGKKLDVRYGPGHKNDVPVNILDNSRIKNLLDWEPQVPLQEGIERTYKYLKENLLLNKNPLLK